MSELAVLAPEVEASLPDDRKVPPAVHAATAAVVAELYAEAARHEDGAAASVEGATEVARLLREFAGTLAQRHAWRGVDRLVHELVSDLLSDVLRIADGGRTPALIARAFLLNALARHAVLWPGAGPRLGCVYGYDSILASVRLAALAA